MTRPQVERARAKEIKDAPKGKYQIKVIPGLFVVHRIMMFERLITELIGEVHCGRS